MGCISMHDWLECSRKASLKKVSVSANIAKNLTGGRAVFFLFFRFLFHCFFPDNLFSSRTCTRAYGHTPTKIVTDVNDWEYWRVRLGVFASTQVFVCEYWRVFSSLVRARKFRLACGHYMARACARSHTGGVNQFAVGRSKCGRWG